MAEERQQRNYEVFPDGDMRFGDYIAPAGGRVAATTRIGAVTQYIARCVDGDGAVCTAFAADIKRKYGDLAQFAREIPDVAGEADAIMENLKADRTAKERRKRELGRQGDLF